MKIINILSVFYQRIFFILFLSSLTLIIYCEPELKNENEDFILTGLIVPPAGTYLESTLEIALVTTNKSSSIRYTLDGVTEPGKDQGTLYTAPIVINQSTTLKHVVIDSNGKTSRVVTSIYTLRASSLSTINVLSLSTTSIIVSSAATTQTINVNSNLDWSVSSNNLTMCPQPIKGADNRSVSFSVTANNAVNATPRFCTLTFSATGVTNVVATINQAASSLYFRTSVIPTEVSSGARTIGVTVSSNTDWSLFNATSAHCTISTTSGTGDGTFNISILNNTSNTDRLCAISIPDDFIRITQHRPLTITSANFTHNDTLHSDFTANAGAFGSCTGKNDFPQLSWNKTLSTIQSFVLIVDDPDGLNWVHLNLYNIPSTTTSIARLTANASHEVTFPNGQVGQNDFNGLGSGIPGTGWGGPCPPNGTHNYNFKIYAMSVSTLGSALNNTTRATFEATYGPEGNNQILDSAVIIGRVAAP